MKGRITLALLLVTALLLNMCLIGVNVSTVSAQEVWPLPVPRDETIALCGYWPDPSYATSVPCIMDWGQCMETYIMYEPLFGTDVASKTRINWLGQNIEWVNPTTIRITLRSGPYWVKITDWDAWQAGTGGVEYYRPIDANDVWFSFYLYGGLPESPEGKYWHAGALRDRIINMTVVDDKTLLVYLKPEYANSIVVMRRLTASYLIVPADVWQEIEAAYPGWVPSVGNRWTDPAFRADHPGWLVASGMYLPYQQQIADWPHYTLMQKNPLWWGIDILGRQPAPKYFVNLNFEKNEDIYPWMEKGWIDWDGNYVPKLTWQPAGYNTYFANPPYFPDKSAKILVPNHRRWPLCEPWLSRAIYGVVASHFEDYNSVSEGYLKPASPLYIPADDAVARRLLNTTIENYFKLRDDGKLVVKAPDGSDVWATPLEILDMYGDFIGGAWYMNLDQAAVNATWVAKYLSDDPYLQIGETTRKASEWAADSDWSDDVDDLPTVAGIQVKLPSVAANDPWIINDIKGWSDINAISILIAQHITSDLGIYVRCDKDIDLIEYSDYEGKMNTLSTEEGVAFDFVHYCMHWGINGEMYERYAQFYNGPPGAYNNYGDNRNPEISALLAELDTMPYGSPEEQEKANQIQWLVGYWCNPIATAGHPDWYLYLPTYWVRWPNEIHAFLAASPYGGSTQVANLHFILLALGVTGWDEDVTNDGWITMEDIGIACRAYGSFPTHPRWDFAADINSDGYVDMVDIGSMCRRFGQHRV